MRHRLNTEAWCISFNEQSAHCFPANVSWASVTADHKELREVGICDQVFLSI
jgi:hypothetical protein